MMMNLTHSVDLQVGDRVLLAAGMLRGRTAKISAVNEDVTYFLIGDWTKQTGFVLVNYGPVDRQSLKKLQTASSADE